MLGQSITHHAHLLGALREDTALKEQQRGGLAQL